MQAVAASQHLALTRAQLRQAACQQGLRFFTQALAQRVHAMVVGHLRQHRLTGVATVPFVG